VTSDPEPGSDGFPLPPATVPPGFPAAYGPPSYGIAPHGQPPWAQAPYGQPPYGQPAGYGPFPYGAPQGHYVQPGMLAAAADRERTMDVLKAAYTEGRLTKNEFDERSARVLDARTYGELNALVTDLPAGPGGSILPMPMPYPPGYYPPAVVPRTNGFAIGALVCGIVPFFGGIPAVILGHVARGQIKQTGERGDGVATAGLILGYMWLSLWMLIILIGIAHS
jgi:Domain of unknown function (DUF1707)/Domain of unknown function (DUF4190)